jgi:hypothetical protein
MARLTIMTEALSDDLLYDKDLAIRIAELLCEAHYGDLRKQTPLSVTDGGYYWRVEGNRNRDGAINGPAEFFLSIEKHDGRVTDFGQYVRCPPHPWVVQVLREDHNDEKSNSNLASASATQSNNETSDLPSVTGTLFLIELARGGVIFDARLATNVVEALFDAHHYDDKVEAPMLAEDRGKYWRVERSRKQEGDTIEASRLYACIQKYDGRVIEFGECRD